ncbi:hypothetical protein D3C85_1248620 [compost metagenome]
MEKLFLRAFLASKELNIVDQQCVNRAVETLEFVNSVELQCLDHIRDETLGMQVDNLGIGILLEQVVTHSMHQVRFTQAYAPIKEERVIAMLRVIGYLPGRCAGELVRFTFDEVFERKRAIEVARVLERTFDLDSTLLGTHRCRL